MNDSEQRPVLWGIAALGLAAVAAGLVVGLGLVFGLGMVGLGGGGGDSSAAPAAQETLFLPTPTPTETEAPDDESETSDDDAPDAPDGPAKVKRKPIEIVVGQTTVAPMAQIDITGTATLPDGAILRVQRFENEAWVDFPVTARVEGQRYATYVQTGREGVNRFRMIDTDSGKASKAVEVTIG